MTSRERVLEALAHRATDRVPRLLYEEAIGYTPAVERMLRRHCAPRSPRARFDMDITGVGFNPTRLPRERFVPWLDPEDAADALARGEVDEWGVRWRAGALHHFARVESPLGGKRAAADLASYPWPDIDEGSRYAATQFARAGVDILITGDDVAGQKGLLMRPDTWRTFLKPHLAATIRAARETRRDLAVFYHSDGDVTALIPELIEVGVDILNPVQPECMDPAAVKRAFGDRLAFWGTVSVQRTLPFGTPDDVRAEVRARIAEVGRGGGLILAPAHVLGPEVPWDNIVAFFDAADSTPVPRG